MFSKTVILFFIIFCSQEYKVYGQSTPIPGPKPTPSPNAQKCISELNNAKIIDGCHNKSMSIWNPLQRGQNVVNSRELCCEIYEEIDCIITALNSSSSLCKGTKQDMYNHENQEIWYWQLTSCTNIHHNDIMCDPNFIPSTPKPDPYGKPKPSPGAQQCINELTGAGFVDKCQNQSITIWDPLNRGRELGSIREFCCEAYGEIDCISNVTRNNLNHCQTTRQAMLNHQNTLNDWLQKTFCTSIKYHSGKCDPDQYNNFPPPKPRPVANCQSKIYQEINHCEDQSKKDWKVKPTDTPFSQSVCCSRFQINDCYVTAAKEKCNSTEFIQFNQYYHDMNMNISKTNCTENQYQSFNCFNPGTTFPPPPPPGALNCTGKIFDKFPTCSARAAKQWNASVQVLTGKNACCANWDVFDCILTEAQDKCTLLELSEFEQYYNFLAQTITKVNCTSFGYHSEICKTAIRNPTSEVSNCLSKIKQNQCKGNDKWKVQGMNATNAKAFNTCCKQLSINNCLDTRAMDKCNTTELKLFRKYLTDNTNFQCNQILSFDECQSGSPNVHANFFIIGIILIIISIYSNI